MSTARLHLPDLGTAPGDDLGPSLCGYTAVVVQAVIEGHPRACKRCLTVKKQRDSHIATRPVGWEEALAEVAHVICGPRTTPFPPLSPELWRDMRCLSGRRCLCEVCQIDEANRTAWMAWEAEQQIRPHQRHAYPFGSVNAALELLLRWKQDGSAARSFHGSLMARGKELDDLGTFVQTTRRADREDLVTRRATYAHDVETACRWAFSEEQSRRGLEREQCVTVLLSSVDATAPTPAQWAERWDVSERAIKALISHGRRAVKTWLAANDYTPSPRSRDGLDEDIRRLRERLGGAA